MRTNYDKAKMNNTQHNSKRRFCGQKDETVNHIVSERSELGIAPETKF